MNASTARRRFLLLSTLLWTLVSTAVAVSEQLEVVFVDGVVEVRADSSWQEAVIGDRLSADSWVRLERGALAELALADPSGPGVTICLSRAGDYFVGNLVEQYYARVSQGVDRHLSNLLENALGGRVRATDTVMGVRGKRRQPSGDQWTDELAREMLLAGIELLEQERYEEALALFLELLEVVDPRGESEVLFYTGYTHEQMRQPMRALRYLRTARLDRGHRLYEEHVLLTARLLVESLAYEEALAWLDAHPLKTGEAAGEAATAQAALLLRALSYRGREDTGAYRHALVQIIQLDPGTETGLLAQELLSSL